MNLLDIIKRWALAPTPGNRPVRAASLENPSTPLSDPDLFYNMGYGVGGGRFGETVNEHNAVVNATVFRCVAIISGLVGTLPLRVYQDDPELGRVEASDHRTADLFNVAPNPNAGPTAYTWKEMLSSHILTYGNGFSALRYDKAARLVAIDLVQPPTVEVRMQAGRQIYVVNWPHRDREVLDASDMLHFTGPLSPDGIMGLPRIRSAARDSIAIARSIQTTTGAAFDNALRPSIKIKVPKDVGVEAMRRIAGFFSGEGAGQMNAGKPLFLQDDMDATPFTVSMDDLLAVEAAKYSVAEISRFFGVPLVLLNENQNTTAYGAGISELVRGLLRFTLDSDLVRIESEINRKIFAKSPYYAMFDRDALLATDPKSMAETIQIEVNSGVLTINEARAKRHRGRVAGGDTILVNAANVPLAQALAGKAPAPPASAPSEPDADDAADPAQ